jgi:D-alanine-D-alanine ligase-like ATP-grasp enzyme/acylphosphatase/L-alanine-DL-glutamate epimerase-like enolase superfamily enzyme
VSASIRVESVEVIRYERLVSGRTVSRALVRLAARAPGGPVLRATGDGRLGLPGRRHGGWNALLEAAGALEGRLLPSVPLGTPPRELAERIRPLLPPCPRDEGEQATGVRQAIELALLDLFSRAHACDLPSLLGRRPAVVTASADEAIDLSGPDGLLLVEEFVARGSERFPLLRLTGEAAADLDGIIAAVAADRAAGRDRKLWLTMEEGSAPNPRALVEDLAIVLREGGVPSVYLELPVDAISLAESAELQDLATATVGRDDSIRIAARTSLAGSEVPSQAEIGLPGALILDMSRHGSVLEVIATADELERCAPTVEVGLVSSSTHSEFGRWSMLAVASACPGVSHLFGVQPRTSAPWLTSTRLAYRGESNELTRLNAPGIVPELDHLELASFISRRQHYPPVEPGSAVQVRPINQYTRPSYVGPFTSNQMFQVEALAGGLSLTRHTPYLFTVDGGQETTAVGFERGRCDTAEVAHRGAWSKHLTKELLTTAGFSVPSGASFATGDVGSAREFGHRHGFPLVVKPVEGRKGIGITTDIKSKPELDDAIRAAESCIYGESGFIVERFVTGADYRILVLGDKVLSVVLREPANVIGDGRHTIAELVTAKNLERRKNHHLALGRMIEFNTDADLMLERQGLDAHSVPRDGVRVVLRSVSNQSAGGDSTEVLDDTHPSVLDLAVRAVAAIPGLVHAGLDVLLEDHRASITDETFDIIEVNESPAMGLHHWVMFGQARNVTRKVVGFYVRRGGLDLYPRQRSVSVRLTVHGTVVGVGFRAWLAREAEKRGLSGWAANTVAGELVGVLAGPVEHVSATIGHAIRGPARAFPTRVRCEPEPEPSTEGFVIREGVLR